MNKTITFKSIFDTTDFDKSVSEMQKKLKDISSPAEMMKMQQQTNQRLGQAGLGGMSAPSMEAYQKATQSSRRETDQFISEQVKGQEKLGKIISQRTDTLKKLQDQQKQMVKDSEEEFKIKEKIARFEENSYKMREQYRRNDMIINQTLEVRENENAARQESIRERNPSGWGRAGRFAGQGMYGAAGKEAFGAMGGLGGMAGGLGAILGTLGSASGVVGNIIGATAGAPMRVEAAKGTAVQQTLGQDLQKVYSGKSMTETAFMPEREKAAGIAEKKSEKERTADLFKAFGTATSGALSGAWKGALAGGAAGLAFGGIGAIPGAIGGGLIGAAGGGISAVAGNDRQRERILGMMPGEFGAGHQKQYDQLLASQRAKDFRETLEDLKNQDPAKKLVIENFEQDYMKNLSIQRTLGINNKQFYGEGGLLNRGSQAGFMPDQMIGMAQSIVGAGGSSRMGQQGQFGLQMERMGMTNAPQLLGTLSGGIQNPEASKKAMVGIISEAFQIGLDNTDFAEEQRRFSQAAVNIISKTGATSEQDQDRLARTLGMFVGEKTNVGIQSAQGAYEKFQERGSQLGGRRGALRMMDALQDPSLRKIPTNELTELLGMRPEELNEGSDVVQYFAKQAGITPKELIEKVTKGSKGSRFLIPGSKQKVEGFQKTVNDYMKEKGLSHPELEEMQKQGQLPPEVSSALGGLKVRTQMEEKGGLTSRESAAAAGEFLEGGAPTMSLEERKKATTGMLTSTGERLEDKKIAGEAGGADKLRQQFVLLVPELERAVAGIKKFADGANSAGDEFNRKSGTMRSNLPSGNAYGSDIYRTVLPASSQPSTQRPQK